MEYLTEIPTSEPTEAPTIINKPTYAPTKMTSPIMLFSSNITINTILNSPVLDTKSQHTLINVTAWSMKVTENTITYKKGIATTSLNHRNLRSVVTLFTTTYNIIATIQANVPLSSTGFTSPILLYNSMTSSLTQAVNTGAFTKQLREMSIVFNATQTAKANVTYVSNSVLTVNDIIYVSPVSIEGVSAVSVILMTTAIFIVICGLYTYCRTTITARIHDEQQIHEGKEGQSRFSSVIIF